MGLLRILLRFLSPVIPTRAQGGGPFLVGVSSIPPPYYWVRVRPSVFSFVPHSARLRHLLLNAKSKPAAQRAQDLNNAVAHWTCLSPPSQRLTREAIPQYLLQLVPILLCRTCSPAFELSSLREQNTGHRDCVSGGGFYQLFPGRDTGAIRSSTARVGRIPGTPKGRRFSRLPVPTTHPPLPGRILRSSIQQKACLLEKKVVVFLAGKRVKCFLRCFPPAKQISDGIYG